MEHALQRCVKSQSGIVVATVVNRIVGIAVAVDVAAELLCVDHIVHSMLVALIGNQRTFRQRFLRHGTHTLPQPFAVVNQQHRVGSCKPQQRLAAACAGRQIIDHRNLIDRLLRQLRFYIERANAFDVVAKKVDTVGLLIGE